jgi:hypothetical protein
MMSIFLEICFVIGYEVGCDRESGVIDDGVFYK